MEIANCVVCLNGDIKQKVAKPNVTPPEVLILNAIHGKGALQAVIDIAPVKMDRRSHASELQRLKEAYPRYVEVIEAMFPGFNPDLPVAFADTGLEIGEAPDEGLSEIEDADEGMDDDPEDPDDELDKLAG